MLSPAMDVVLPALRCAAIVLILEPARCEVMPTATDIAFALAILAIFGRGLPSALRVFLLALRRGRDVLAIAVHDHDVAAATALNPWCLVGGRSAIVAGFALAVRMRSMRWWVLARLAALAWVFIRDDAATGCCGSSWVVVRLATAVGASEWHGRATETGQSVHYRPAVCVAGGGRGISLSGDSGPLGALADPVAIAIVGGIDHGQLVGVLGVTALVADRALRLGEGDRLSRSPPRRVSLTRDRLQQFFASDRGTVVQRPPSHEAAAKFAMLVASVLTAVLGAFTLRWDARRARDADINRDWVADWGQRDDR